MDHTAVVRQKITERYLLDELDPQLRDEYEEHYFGCQACAIDVSAGAQFVEHAKSVLGERTEPVPVQAAPRHNQGTGWFAWLRPAFAAPALALLLAVIGYQNLRFQAELNQPRVLPAVSVNVGTWGPGGPSISVPAGKGLLLFVRIPPDGAYARYSADLHSPSGKLEGSFTIEPAAGQDQWPVTIPALHREPGTYTLGIHGITSQGTSKDLGTTSFELQIQ